MSFVVRSAQFLLGRLRSHVPAPALVGPDREAMRTEQLAPGPLPRPARSQTICFGLGFGFDLAALFPPTTRAERD